MVFAGDVLFAGSIGRTDFPDGSFEEIDWDTAIREVAHRFAAVRDGQRILPEGFVKFVSTVAPAWAADKRMVYGGFFWVNGEGTFPVPREAYYMSGAGGQTVLIVPSHDLVVVRIGHFKGARPGGEAFRRALALLIEAVPPGSGAATTR